jgi:hypothetical protein
MLLLPLLVFFGLLCLRAEAASDGLKLLNRTIERVSVSSLKLCGGSGRQRYDVEV